MSNPNQFVDIEFLNKKLDLAIDQVLAFTKQFTDVSHSKEYRFVHFAGAAILPEYPYKTRVFLHEQCDYRDVRNKQLGREELLDTLSFNGQIPTWININMLDIRDGLLIFEIWSGFQSTNDYNQLMHQQEGIPPFHCLSPALPASYVEGKKFSLPSSPAYKQAMDTKD